MAAQTSPDAPMAPQQAMQLLQQLGITEEALPLVAKAILTVVGAQQGGPPPGAGGPPPGGMPPPGAM